MSSSVTEALRTQYRKRFAWTVQLHVDNLRTAFKDSAIQVASYPSICRYMKAQEMLRQAQP